VIPYTQTSLGLEGNCLQTSIECILEVPQGSLPAQRDYPLGGYLAPLSEYLRRMGLVYFDLPACRASFAAGGGAGWHVLTGPSVRTPQLGTLHSVVACGGRMVWDPHPSRQGLTGATSWGVVARVEAA